MNRLDLGEHAAQPGVPGPRRGIRQGGDLVDDHPQALIIALGPVPDVEGQTAVTLSLMVTLSISFFFFKDFITWSIDCTL